MKLYLKQKLFSWRDKFYIYDVNGNSLFYVEGELLSLGKKLHIYDNSGNELAFIHQKLLSMLPRYFISVGGNEVAEVVKEFTFLKPRYRVNGPGWSVQGKFLAMDYSITQNGYMIAQVSKQWLTWADTYEIDVVNDNDVLLALCTTLVIDAVISASRNSSAVTVINS